MIAAEFSAAVDERPAGRELPRGHVNAVLASHPGPKALFVARSTTGWVGWAEPASGRPKDGVLFPLPDRPPASGRAQPSAPHGRVVAGTPRLAVDDVWTGLRFEAAIASIRPVPVYRNTTHPRRFTVATDNAEPPSDKAVTAPCRCLASDAVEDRHRSGCLIKQTIARVNVKLEAESGQDPWLIADLVESGPEWGHDAVLPNGAVLLLVASPPPLLPGGLWQRQDKLLVAVTEESYGVEVERCGTFRCGLCGDCRREPEYVEQRVQEIRDAAEAFTAALAAYDKATAAWKKVVAWDIGDDYDLAHDDKSMGKRWLATSRRGLRGTELLIAAHLATVEKLAEVARGD